MHKTYDVIIKGIALLAVPFLLLAALPQTANAAAVTPGAGSILQQANPKKAPAPSGTNTGLTTGKPKAGVPASKVSFEVKAIRITGNTLFSTAELHALVASDEGKRLTLKQLHDLAGKITDYYRAHGYPLSRALIPAQTIRGGVIRFEVLEARFGKISLNNRSRVTKGHLLQSTLAPLKSGAAISDAKLNRSLLLLSDIPGVSLGATFKPGAAMGISDLDVDVKAASRLSGYLSADNYGNQYTGRARLGGGLTLANPLHFGDELTLNGMTSGKGLEYGRVGYDSVVDGCGTQLGAAYSALHYILGGPLTSLVGYGTARVASLWARQPLIRGRTLNLYGKMQYDNQHLRDHINASAIRTDRSVTSWTASVTGDARDGFLGGAVNSWDISWTGGNLSFKDAVAQASDASTANTVGRFYKWAGTLTRLQGLDAKNALYLAVSGQWTTSNLDAVEKLVVGGPNGVRAYDVGVLSADTGYRGTVELRHSLQHGLQAKLFFDSEKVTINHHPWATGKNMASLSGFGAGLGWSGPSRLQLEAVIARPVGPIPELLGKRSSVRGWVQLSKLF